MTFPKDGLYYILNLYSVFLDTANMPSLTIGKIRNMCIGKDDLESKAIILLTNTLSPDVGITTKRNLKDILRVLLNLRGFNMILVGNISPSDCLPENVIHWKNVIQMVAEVEIQQAKMRKIPVITNFQATPLGFLIQWNQNQVNTKTLKHLEKSFNDYDSWGDTIIHTVIAPLESE
jgi:hypothetical protein